MIEQPGYIYFECPACGFDSVQRSDFDGRDACPLCDSDNNRYSAMNQRVCRESDKPEGRDARKDETP